MANYTVEHLNQVADLTGSQYDKAKDKAIKRLEKKVGKKPERKDFKLDYAPLISGIGYGKLLVFVAAVILSTLSILIYVGKSAESEYVRIDNGIDLGIAIFVIIAQVASVALAEFSVLVFSVLFRLEEKNRAENERISVIAIVYLSLVIMSIGFIFYVNILSGFILGYIAPFFTVGIGLSLDETIEEYLKRQKETDERYKQATIDHDALRGDITRHSEFMPLLMQELWDEIVRVNKPSSRRTEWRCGFALDDATPEFKRALTLREYRQKEQWTQGVLSAGLPSSQVRAVAQNNLVATPAQSAHAQSFIERVSTVPQHTATPVPSSTVQGGTEVQYTKEDLMVQWFLDDPTRLDMSVSEALNAQDISNGRGLVNDARKRARNQWGWSE